VQRFIQGDAQGKGESAFSPDTDSTLRWIDPPRIAPVVDAANSQGFPTAVPLVPAQIDVEAATFAVAPDAIRSIPGRMAVTLASRARRLPWEQGEEFLKPEPPPPPEPRILSDREIQSSCVDVAPLAMRQIPGRTLVMLAAKPRQFQWELGEEFLKKEPETDLVPAPRVPSEIDVEAKTLDVAPEGMEQPPGKSLMLLVPPALASAWEMGEDFLKALPAPPPEPIPEPDEEVDSPFVYLRSSFEDNIFRVDEPLDQETGSHNEPAEAQLEAREETLEESANEEVPTTGEEAETGEDFEDEDEEFAEDGEDFGDPPSISLEPLTDSMVLEEPLPQSEPIDPFEPYAESDLQSAEEPPLGDGASESGSSDNDIPPPATPGES
jgi:hypothetical protein